MAANWGMGRKPQKYPSATGPHPWAFLAAWRERVQLTQAAVAEHFDVTDVTIHRWETGKAPVTVAKYLILAKLYHAVDPAALMWPPAHAHEAQKLHEASRIIGKLSDEDLRRWLDVGRSLAEKARSQP